MRTELEDEALMTLKTNCGKIFSKQHSRYMTVEEIFTTLCIPTKTSFVPRLIIAFDILHWTFYLGFHLFHI